MSNTKYIYSDRKYANSNFADGVSHKLNFSLDSFFRLSHWFRFGIAGLDDNYSRITNWRYRSLIGLVLICYIIVSWRLIHLGNADKPDIFRSLSTQSSIATIRPNILDRNGTIVATDVKVNSIYAEPCRIIDVDDAVGKIIKVLPELKISYLRRRLSGKNCFAWIKREITPAQKQQLHDLGIPGIGFLNENTRFYPAGSTTAHIIGLTDIDNKGISGIEKYIDKIGFDELISSGFASGFGSKSEKIRPVDLSIDIRIQSLIHEQLKQALVEYRAIAASAVMLDAKTGEVIAMVSLPDYDPTSRSAVLAKDNLNRAAAGTFELGSVFKTVTIAIGLDSGMVSKQNKFDARYPIRVGHRTISDFHSKKRILTVPEVFIYSSNIGAAKIAEATGKRNQQLYLKRLGLLDELKTELPESAKPLTPRRWSDGAMYTIAFGHSLSVTPLQFTAAGAAIVNGGKYITPTFIKRQKNERINFKQVLKPDTSAFMRYLMRLNVIKGSGSRSAVSGYLVGGKTGTAEKVVNGRYARHKRLNSFLSAFPINDPKYVLLVTLDEPKKIEGQFSATAGLNAAPVTAKIIKVAAPLLGLQPTIVGETKKALDRELAKIKDQDSD